MPSIISMMGPIGPQLAQMETYTVRPGDSMGAIAARHHVSLAQLVQANQDVVHNPDLIYPGQMLVIPKSGALPAPAAHPAARPAVAAQPKGPDYKALYEDLLKKMKEHNKVVHGASTHTGRQSAGGAKRGGVHQGQRSSGGMVNAGHAPWMQVLLTEQRTWQERGGQRRLNNYISETGLGNGDWCSIFANWVMRQTGRHGTGSAGAVSWLNWGRSLSKPLPGCVAVLRDGCFNEPGWHGVDAFHVTFYIREVANGIECLGGNQHHMVDYSKYYWVSSPQRGGLFNAAYRWPA
jgi:uncharacterized protein (TIGR02594 family)